MMMVKINKLKYSPYAQCCYTVEMDKKGNKIIHLISYQTEVITIRNNTLHCTGLYSMTTRKHITYFLREILPTLSLQDIKQALEKNNGYIEFENYAISA